jgi:hypothetical protein
VTPQTVATLREALAEPRGLRQDLEELGYVVPRPPERPKLRLVENKEEDTDGRQA